MTVIVAGAGISGLTLALSLHQIGVPVRVYESVDRLEPLGVGINVLPHSVRELTELGLADQLAATAVPTAALSYYSKRGQLIWTEPRGLGAGYNWPQFSIHRGELQMILYRAVLERLGPESVVTGHHLAGFAQTEDGVTVHFVDRRTGAARASVEGSLSSAPTAFTRPCAPTSSPTRARPPGTAPSSGAASPWPNPSSTAAP